MREESSPIRRRLRPPCLDSGAVLRRRRAYTLLELVMVLAILCLVAGLAVPSLRGFAQGREGADGAQQLVALCRRARTQAITEATTYRLNVDPAAGTYWLTAWRGGTFVDPGDGFGRAFAVPTGMMLTWDGPFDGAFGYAEFQPDGRTTPAIARLTGAASDVLEVGCLTPAEPFEVLPSDQPRATRTTPASAAGGRRR
jgi:prepilin-type N-terminal cleavage/methylation domain-containing protein